MPPIALRKKMIARHRALAGKDGSGYRYVRQRPGALVLASLHRSFPYAKRQRVGQKVSSLPKPNATVGVTE
jgi:hypothetical protein